VYSSSASVYGDAVRTPMDEDHPLNNRNFYGATKISGEAMCRAFHTQHNLSYIGLRYMNVYGPRQDQYAVYTGVIPRLLNAVDGNIRPEIHGDGSQSYDFVYVRDVAKANILALQSDAVDKFYNIGTGVQTSISDLVSEILHLTSSSLIPRYIPYSENDARQFVRKRVGAVNLARTVLGFSAETCLSDGLKRLMTWRKEFDTSR
jgi:UDP-glucose 4-epimerase